MCFGKIKKWWIRRKASKPIKLQRVGDILQQHTEALRGQMKAGRQENKHDHAYFAGYVDALKWVMQKDD